MHVLRRIVVTLVVLGPIVAAGVVYAGLVADGKAPRPDLQALAQQATGVAGGTLAVVVGIAIAFIIVCAAVAPIIYAARSGDAMTVLISLVLTTAAIAMFFNASSVMHEMCAVLVYLANIVLSAIVYAAHRIAPTVAHIDPIDQVRAQRVEPF